MWVEGGGWVGDGLADDGATDGFVVGVVVGAADDVAAAEIGPGAATLLPPELPGPQAVSPRPSATAIAISAAKGAGRADTEHAPSAEPSPAPRVANPDAGLPIGASPQS